MLKYKNVHPKQTVIGIIYQRMIFALSYAPDVTALR